MSPSSQILGVVSLTITAAARSKALNVSVLPNTGVVSLTITAAALSTALNVSVLPNSGRGVSDDHSGRQV
jgi:hypothetical protein